MEYEYRSITPPPLEITAGIGDVSAEELATELTLRFATSARDLTQILSETPELQGYEAVSHSTTRLDRWLVTTYLLRRPKQPKI